MKISDIENIKDVIWYIIWPVAFKRNFIINFWLALFLCGSYFLFKNNYQSIFDVSMGVIGSAAAAFNLIDGYNQYKLKNFEINVIHNLKMVTIEFYNTILDSINEDKYNATGLYLCKEIINHIRIVINKINKTSIEKLNKSVNLVIIKESYLKIKKTISDYGQNIYNENLLLVFIELLSLNQEFENEPEQEYPSFSKVLVLLIPCFEELARYEKKYEIYTKERNPRLLSNI